MLLLSVTYFFFFFLFQFWITSNIHAAKFYKRWITLFHVWIMKTHRVYTKWAILSLHGEIIPSKWDLTFAEVRSLMGGMNPFLHKLSHLSGMIFSYSPRINLPKVNKRNTRKRREIFSKLKIKTPERPQCGRSNVFIDSLEHISHLALVFQSLTFNM